MKTTIILCVLLHITLVSIYVVVLVLAKAGIFDKPLHVSEDRARTAVTVVTQGSTIAYCAVLVFFTQRIALHEIICGQQTLSAMHDKSTAWLGLGSALSVLSNQTTIATDLAGVLFISIYLSCILVVHTTLPGTFGLAVVNTTVDATYPTIIAHQPDVLTAIGIGSLHAILSTYDTLDITTVGVWDNMLYDIIPITNNTANDAVDVNATTIFVDCSPIPDIVQTKFHANGSPISLSDAISTHPAYDFSFGGGKYKGSIVPMEPGALQITAPVRYDYEENSVSPDGLAPSMLLVGYAAGLENWLEKFEVSAVRIDPPWRIYGGNMTTDIYLLGCNFAINNSTVQVNTQTREVSKAITPSAPIARHNWTDPGISSDPLLKETLAYFAASAPLDGTNSVRPNINIFTDIANLTASSFSTVLDVFMYTDLFLTVNGHYGKTTVTDLNHSLAKAYAAVLWYNNVEKSADGTPLERQQGVATIPIVALQVRIAINTLSLAIGLGASSVLLILIGVLIFRTRHSRRQCNTRIDSTGLLPMLWLLSNEPLESLVNIQEPSLDALRAAGMYEVLTPRHASSSRQAISGATGSVEQSEDYTPFVASYESDSLSSGSL